MVNNAEQVSQALAENVISYVDQAIASQATAIIGRLLDLSTLQNFTSVSASTQSGTPPKKITVLPGVSSVAMIGVNKNTGKPLAGIAHLRQSIIDILTTPRGTRVMRRQYGCKLFELIDAPLNGETVLYLYAAIAEALDLWEPRLRVKRLQITDIVESGRATLTITGIYLPSGVLTSIDGIVL